jgi:hypothetical protein
VTTTPAQPSRGRLDTTVTPGSPGLRPRVTPSRHLDHPDATVTGKVWPQPPALIALTTAGRGRPLDSSRTNLRDRPCVSGAVMLANFKPVTC